MTSIRTGALCALTALTIVAVSAPATAVPNFDGMWSVVIVTEKGDCDRAYRYPIRISKGKVYNAGNASFSISGQVADNGAITVRVAHGDKSASGSGRFAGNEAYGSWKGGACAGRWTAERRAG